MSFIVGVLMLIARHVAIAGNILASSDALALSGVIKALLVTSGVFGSVGEASNGFGCFGIGLKIEMS